MQDKEVVSQGMLQEHLLANADRYWRYVDERIPEKHTENVSADDVLQEVWIAAFRGIATFTLHGPDSLDRWLATITKRKLLDAVARAECKKRGGGRERWQFEQSEDGFAGLLAELASPANSPSRDATSKEGVHMLRVALDQLAEPHRRAILLTRIEGRSPAEVGLILGRSDKSVRSLVFHGMRQLRAILGSSGKFFTDADSTVDAAGCSVHH